MKQLYVPTYPTPEKRIARLEKARKEWEAQQHIEKV